MMLQRHSRRRADRSGFTLMEVLVVVAILLVLASVATISIFRYLDDANKSKAHLDLKALTESCKGYKLKNGDFPDSLDQLLTPPDGGKPYLETRESLIDPWGQPYRYDKSGANNGGLRPDIYCTTPDGETIGNWMAAK